MPAHLTIGTLSTARQSFLLYRCPQGFQFPSRGTIRPQLTILRFQQHDFTQRQVASCELLEATVALLKSLSSDKTYRN